MDATHQLSTRSTRALGSLGRSLSAAQLLAPGHRFIWTTATSQLGCLTPSRPTIGHRIDCRLRRATACTAQWHSWIKGLTCSLRVLLTHSLSSGLRQLHPWSNWAPVSTLSCARSQLGFKGKLQAELHSDPDALRGMMCACTGKPSQTMGQFTLNFA